MNGLVGMRYDVFLQWAKEEGVKRLDRVWLLGDLRMMEREYLATLYQDGTVEGVANGGCMGYDMGVTPHHLPWQLPPLTRSAT
jgi:hypothetical protein